MRVRANGMSAGLAPDHECERPDFDRVLPSLAIGGRLSTPVAELLAGQFGIRRVVDLREEEEDDLKLLTRHGIELLRLPTEDLQPIAQEMLWRACAGSSRRWRAAIGS
jgi:hypothetical protein